MDLIYFILCAYGATQLILYGSLFDKIRPRKDSLRGFGKLFHCALCVGFHVGWIFLLIGQSSSLWTYEISLTNLFLLSCLSSGTSYILNRLVNDDGVAVYLNKNE
jgi:uncharacterized membrane protein